MNTSYTVLLPTCDRPDSLRLTLNSLCKVDDTGIDWRVLIVDNSADGSAQPVIAEFANRPGFPLDVLSETGPGKSRALNTALETINRGLVIFVDDDVLFSPGWLQSYVGAERRWPDVGIFGGRITPQFPEGAPQWVQCPAYVHQSVMFSLYDPAQEESLTDAWPIGPNMAIRRSTIDTCRFDVRFGPGGDYSAMGCETEFVRRLIDDAGERIVYIPDAAVEHIVRNEQISREAVWARAYKWGRSRALANGSRHGHPSILGIGLRDWLAAIRAFLRFAPFRFGPRYYYLKYGWHWQVRAGQLRGYRELSRIRRDATSA